MNLAGTPLIPLYQVQANPDARFQRFGRNDGQLFGKPINAELQARPAPVETQPVKEKPAAERAEGAAAARVTYRGPSPRTESPWGASPTLGASLDLKA